MIYKCACCRFYTDVLYNYKRHCLSKKHIINLTIIQPIKQYKFTCQYCEKVFSFKQSMYKHIKYTCTKNKDEDMKELVRLMNLKMEHTENELKKHIENQNKQIEKLMGKLEINGSFNTINNIQLLAYKDTDVSHLTDKDYSFCIKQVNYCVKKLIEKIHFNPAKPENMNIYISNIKDKYMMVYDGTNWTLSTKEYELGKIYEEKEILLEEWLENNEYPEIKEKFVRYLNNKEKDDNLNAIKADIKLMMYNKKNLIEI